MVQRVTAALARIPILGYFLKVAHDICYLPLLRRDLVREIRSTQNAVSGALESLASLHSDFHETRQTIGLLGDIPSRLREFQRSLVRVDARLDELKARLGDVERVVKPLRGDSGTVQPLPSNLDALESRLPQLEARLQEARKKAAALERDVWRLEKALTHQGTTSSVPQPLPALPSCRLAAKLPGPAVFVNPDKLLRLSGDIRLNLGCGEEPIDGYINVDERSLPGVDLVCNVTALPFTRGSVAEIRAAHLLEHFRDRDLQSHILPDWYSLLKPGGRLTIIVPDAEGMITQYVKGDRSWESLRLVTFGEQDYTGNFHYNMFSREGLRARLEAAGFILGDYAALGRPNGECLEMEITAVKPDQ